MRNRYSLAFGLLAFFAPMLHAQTAPTIVRFRTNLGDIDVTMIPESAPKNVANFLKYVNKGAYNNSFIHRSVTNFIIQGGGYNLIDHNRVAIPADAAVSNEYSVSNLRGTLSMALTAGDKDSATTQWFFNLGSNTGLNSTSNGPFTVFGRINSSAGLDVMDKIGRVSVSSFLASPFDQLPLQNYFGGDIQDSNYVLVPTVYVLPPPAVTQNGIVSASAFGGFDTLAPGSFAEIYGSNLSDTTRGWADTDFINGNAPLSLDGVIVTVDGKQAYVNYVSPTQINIQVPAGISTGAVPVMIYYKNQASAKATVNVKPLSPGLLAPSSFKVGDKQYVAAVHGTSGTFVSGGNIPDVPAAPAVPGETVIFYGVGFGPVNESSVPVAGKVVTGPTTLAASANFKFGDVAAEVQYAGLVQGLVGVYQFNVVVPAGVSNGDVPLNVTVNGEAVAQSLLVSVKN
ncbi:MAG: peptidylprolyl isomerase [Bryobacteraceae bacterium]